MNLSLNDAVKDEVRNTYKQYIKQNGRRVLITTKTFKEKQGPTLHENNGISSMLVPLDCDTINTLRCIEDFVKENVDSPCYKPLWLQNAMYVNVSKWCLYEVLNPDGSIKPASDSIVLGSGWYTFQISVSHVYIGPHRGGQTFSLSLHVTKVTYQPQDILDATFDTIMRELNTPSTSDVAVKPPTPPKTEKKKKKQRRRKVNVESDPSTVPAKLFCDKVGQ